MEQAAQARKIRFGKRKFAVGAIAPSALVLVCLSLALFWVSRDWRANSYFWELDLALWCCLIVATAVLWSSLSPRKNFLVLYDDGLTLQRGIWGRHWPWQDLSAFQIQQVKTFRFYDHRSRVLSFVAPGSDWQSRFLRWYFRLPSRPPAIVIENIYDAPLDNIAAKLNEHRARALATGGACPGSGAPA